MGVKVQGLLPALFKIIRAGCIVMKIPINNTATSWIAPHVKWFCTLTSFGVVLNERNAAKSISTISIIDGTDSLTSPKIGNESTSPAAFWNTESPGSTPLNITAITISTINKKLCAPFYSYKRLTFFNFWHKTHSYILLVCFSIKEIKHRKKNYHVEYKYRHKPHAPEERNTS